MKEARYFKLNLSFIIYEIVAVKNSLSYTVCVGECVLFLVLFVLYVLC